MIAEKGAQIFQKSIKNNLPDPGKVRSNRYHTAGRNSGVVCKPDRYLVISARCFALILLQVCGGLDGLNYNNCAENVNRELNDI